MQRNQVPFSVVAQLVSQIARYVASFISDVVFFVFFRSPSPISSSTTEMEEAGISEILNQEY